MSEPSVFRTFFRDTFLFGIGTNLSTIAGFLLVPMYARTLKVFEYGEYSLLEVFLQIVSVFYTFAFSVYYLKRFSEEKGEAERESVFHHVVTSYTIVSGVFLVSLGAAISLILQRNQHVDVYIYCVSIGFVESLNILLLSDFRARRRLALFVGAGLFQTLATLTLTIFFVAVMTQGVRGILVARLLAGSLTLAAILFILREKIRIRFSPPEFVRVLKFGLPLLPATLFGVLIAGLPRYVLESTWDLASVGVFSMGAKVADIYRLFVNTPLVLSWGFLSFYVGQLNDAPKIYARLETYVFLWALAVAALMIAIERVLFTRFVSGEFSRAMGLFPLFLLVLVFDVVHYYLNVGFYLKERTGAIGLILFFSLLSCATLCFLLIPSMGILGAVLSLAIPFFLRNALLLIWSRNFYAIPLEWGRLAKVSVVFLVLAFVIRNVSLENVFLEGGVRVALTTAIFPLLLYAFAFFDRGELTRMKGFVEDVRARGLLGTLSFVFSEAKEMSTRR